VSTRFRVADAYVEAKTRDAQGERWTARQRARFAYVELEVHQAVLGIPPLVIEEAV
jgi:hypothetical protein